jgi:16S rRNA (guanine966-N2)-methyltransferase
VGFLRIIAGDLRGRRVAVVEGMSLRPTADRVREALFSIVGPEVRGARVLDAYAGTGALGFEALSRGAAEVTFVEAEGRAVEALLGNGRRLGLAGRFSVRRGAVLELLERRSLRGPFDLVLADPPYASREAQPFLAQAAGLVRPGGSIVLERASRSVPVTTPGLEHVRRARYGDSSLDFYRRVAPAPG